jgi:hypothetical protein
MIGYPCIQIQNTVGLQMIVIRSPSSILISGAVGRGSIVIQLAKNLVNDLSPSTSFPGINVIATASRAKSGVRKWAPIM